MHLLTLFAVLWWFLVTYSWHSSQCIHACYRLRWRIFHSLLVSLRWFPQYHTKCATPRSHNCNQSCTWFHLEPHLETKKKWITDSRKETEQKKKKQQVEKRPQEGSWKTSSFDISDSTYFPLYFVALCKGWGQQNFRWYMFLIYFSQEFWGALRFK